MKGYDGYVAMMLVLLLVMNDDDDCVVLMVVTCMPCVRYHGAIQFRHASCAAAEAVELAHIDPALVNCFGKLMNVKVS